MSRVVTNRDEQFFCVAVNGESLGDDLKKKNSQGVGTQESVKKKKTAREGTQEPVKPKSTTNSKAKE